MRRRRHLPWHLGFTVDRHRVSWNFFIKIKALTREIFSWKLGAKVARKEGVVVSGLTEGTCFDLGIKLITSCLEENRVLPSHFATSHIWLVRRKSLRGKGGYRGKSRFGTSWSFKTQVESAALPAISAHRLQCFPPEKQMKTKVFETKQIRIGGTFNCRHYGRTLSPLPTSHLKVYSQL